MWFSFLIFVITFATLGQFHNNAFLCRNRILSFSTHIVHNVIQQIFRVVRHLRNPRKTPCFLFFHVHAFFSERGQNQGNRLLLQRQHFDDILHLLLLLRLDHQGLALHFMANLSKLAPEVFNRSAGGRLPLEATRKGLFRGFSYRTLRLWSHFLKILLRGRNVGFG